MFFFSSRRRHTRCLSDWSSDVCSSDLANTQFAKRFCPIRLPPQWSYEAEPVPAKRIPRAVSRVIPPQQFAPPTVFQESRSEERRVGKEGRARGRQDHEKQKRKARSEAP